MGSSSQTSPHYFRVLSNHPSLQNSLFRAKRIHPHLSRSSRNRFPKHDFYKIIYLVEGGGTFRIGGVTHDIQPGTMILVFPHVEYVLEKTAGGRTEYMFWFRGWPFPPLEKQGVISRKRMILSVGINPTLISMCEELVRDFVTYQLKDQSVYLARIHLLLAEIVRAARNFENQSESVDFPTAAKKLLASNLQSSLELRSVARAFKMSYELFRKRFALEMGISPGQYRIQCRIEYAKNLLKQGHVSLKDIAEVVGYSETHFFSRQFKQVTGQSPSRYRVTANRKIKAATF